MDIDTIRNTLGVRLISQLKMPSLNGRVIEEPTEIDAARLMRLGERGELYKAPKKHVDWICYRLLPSLMRYGVYPPPYEAPPANDSMF